MVRLDVLTAQAYEIRDATLLAHSTGFHMTFLIVLDTWILHHYKPFLMDNFIFYHIYNLQITYGSLCYELKQVS